MIQKQDSTVPVPIQQQDPTRVESVTTVDIPYSPPVSPEIKGNVEAYTGNISNTPIFDRA